MTIPEIPTEPDRISGRTIAALAAVTVAVIVASGIVVWLLAGVRATGGGEGGIDQPPSEQAAAFGAVDTPTFGTRIEAERTRAEQRARLDGWLDGAIDRYLAAHDASAHDAHDAHDATAHGVASPHTTAHDATAPGGLR